MSETQTSNRAIRDCNVRCHDMHGLVIYHAKPRVSLLVSCETLMFSGADLQGPILSSGCQRMHRISHFTFFLPTFALFWHV